MDVAAFIAVLALAVVVLVRLVRRRPDIPYAPLATGIFIGLAVAIAVGLLGLHWFKAPAADVAEIAKLIDVQRKDVAEIGHTLQVQGEALDRKITQIGEQVKQIDGSLKKIEPIVSATDELIKQHVKPQPPPPPPPPKPAGERTALDRASVAAGNTVRPELPAGMLQTLQSADIRFCLLQGDTGNCQPAPETKGCPHNFYDAACKPLGGRLAHVDPQWAQPHGQYCIVIAYTLKTGGNGIAWGGPVELAERRSWSRGAGDSSKCESIAGKQAVGRS